MYVSRLDFNKILHEAAAISVPEGGTPAELEAMARVGLGGAKVFNVGGPEGPVRFASPEWYEIFAHAPRGINDPDGDSIRRLPIASGLFLVCSGNRTVTENRRSPSNTQVAGFPPIAVSMTSCTSPTFIP